MKRTILIVFVTFLSFSCAKVPENFIAPQVKLSIIDLKSKNIKNYKIHVEAALHNENQFTAFLNVKGKALLLNRTGDKIIEEIFFSVPILFPLNSSRIKFEKDINEATIIKIMKEYGIDENLLKTASLIDDTNIEDKNIILKEITFEKKDIIDLLEGKLNEKN